jgi:hypothetical protein
MWSHRHFILIQAESFSEMRAEAEETLRSKQNNKA